MILAATDLEWCFVYDLRFLSAKTSLRVKVNTVAGRFHKKFGRWPTLVYVNTERTEKEISAGTEEHPIRVIPTDAVEFNYIILGDPDVEWEDRYLT